MKKLKWGETPWDDLPKEELLRETQRMFAALESAHSVLNVLKANNERSAFWGEYGSGGRALDRAAQVIDSVYETYDAESVYRSFFRYATSLLFDVKDGDKWIICPTCGGMLGGIHAIRYVGTVCSEHPIPFESTCMGVLRYLEWKDLAGKEDKE